MLGPTPHHHQSVPTLRRRSPSYSRRQERRKAARAACEQPPSSDVVAEEANKNSDKEVNVTEEEKVADEASFEYPCEICDFKSNRESGLHIHMSRKHKTLEQIDGHSEYNDIDTEYDDEIEDYLKTGVLGSGGQLWEDLLFYLKRSKDKLEALEARRFAIEREEGIGRYLLKSDPEEWNLMYFSDN